MSNRSLMAIAACVGGIFISSEAVCTENLDSDVVVMKSAQDGA
jgi:hypothetical protein